METKNEKTIISQVMEGVFLENPESQLKLYHRGICIEDFIEAVIEMRRAQKIYSENFPTGYECYAPTEFESKVDNIIGQYQRYIGEEEL